MRNNFVFDTNFNKIKLNAGDPWMGFQLGEDELGIENQGRLRISNSFSQETEALGQQTPRIGGQRLKLRELSAGCARYSDSTPHLSFYPTALNKTVGSFVAPSLRLCGLHKAAFRASLGRASAAVIFLNAYSRNLSL